MVDYNPPFETIATFFGIWHEHKRGGHKGLHEFYFENNYLLLLNIHEDISVGTYRSLMPSSVRPLRRDDFNRKAVDILKSKKIKNKIVAAQEAGMSCDDVCRDVSKRCKDELLDYANNCESLQAYFPCTQCVGSIGSDQPAYVKDDAPVRSLPRSCLYNYDTKSVPLTCQGSHPDTKRLCVCE
jgi:hypothetical protein